MCLGMLNKHVAVCVMISAILPALTTSSAVPDLTRNFESRRHEISASTPDDLIRVIAEALSENPRQSLNADRFQLRKNMLTGSPRMVPSHGSLVFPSQSPFYFGAPMPVEKQVLVQQGPVPSESISSLDEDYEDFPDEVPTMMKNIYAPSNDVLVPAPKKRYLGIDIPDYISTGGRSDAIKHMSDKMKAMG